jgi:hypothetical protein
MSINFDDLTIADVKRLAAMAAPFLENAPKPTAPCEKHMRPVIVRSRDAGVQFGYLDRYEGSTVYLRNARQMWSWTAASGGTLLDCAMHGVKAGKFSGVADAVIVIGACAIIDCSDAAVKSLESAQWG